jgi:hypothetical protein
MDESAESMVEEDEASSHHGGSEREDDETSRAGATGVGREHDAESECTARSWRSTAWRFPDWQRRSRGQWSWGAASAASWDQDRREEVGGVRERTYNVHERRLMELGGQLRSHQGTNRFRGKGRFIEPRPGRMDFDERQEKQEWNQRVPEMRKSETDATYLVRYLIWLSLQLVFRRLPCQNKRTSDEHKFGKYGMHKRIFRRLKALGGVTTVFDEEDSKEKTALAYDALKTVVWEEFSYVTGELPVPGADKKYEHRIVVGNGVTPQFADVWEKERLVLTVLSAYMATEEMSYDKAQIMLAERGLV